MRLLKSSDYFASHLPLRVQSQVVSRTFEPHAHEFFEIALVLSGRSRHATALGEGELSAGSLILLRPGAWHSLESPRSLRIVNCLFGRELLGRELAPALQDPALRVALAPPLASRPSPELSSEPSAGQSFEPSESGVLLLALEAAPRRACARHLSAIEGLQAQHSTPANALARLGHLNLFLSLLAGSLQVPSLIEARFPRGHEGVRACIAALEQDPARPWTLPELARRAHLNPRYLIQLFKRDTGLSPIEYAHRLRLEQAATLLAQSDQAIARVAQAVGWEDANYFARRFRAHFGCAPGCYRARFRL